MEAERDALVFDLINLLSKKRFSVSDEKKTQEEIESVLMENNFNYVREYMLDIKNTPDFFIDGIAIEVKIKGNAKQIYKQVERYSKFEKVKCILVITNRSMGFPETINSKPCYVIKLGASWL